MSSQQLKWKPKQLSKTFDKSWGDTSILDREVNSDKLVPSHGETSRSTASKVFMKRLKRSPQLVSKRLSMPVEASDEDTDSDDHVMQASTENPIANKHYQGPHMISRRRGIFQKKAVVVTEKKPELESSAFSFQYFVNDLDAHVDETTKNERAQTLKHISELNESNLAESFGSTHELRDAFLKGIPGSAVHAFLSDPDAHGRRYETSFMPTPSASQQNSPRGVALPPSRGGLFLGGNLPGNNNRGGPTVLFPDSKGLLDDSEGDDEDVSSDSMDYDILHVNDDHESNNDDDGDLKEKKEKEEAEVGNTVSIAIPAFSNPTRIQRVARVVDDVAEDDLYFDEQDKRLEVSKFHELSPRARIEMLDLTYKYNDDDDVGYEGGIVGHGMIDIDGPSIPEVPINASDFVDIVTYFGDMIHHQLSRDRDLRGKSTVKLTALARNRMARLLAYNIKVSNGRVKQLFSKQQARLYSLRMQREETYKKHRKKIAVIVASTSIPSDTGGDVPTSATTTTTTNDDVKTSLAVIDEETNSSSSSAASASYQSQQRSHVLERYLDKHKFEDDGVDVDDAENELLVEEPLSPRTLKRRLLTKQPLEFSVMEWMKKHDILVKHTLDPVTKERYRKVFELLDSDGGGSLDIDELDEALTSLNLRFNANELESIARSIDHNFDGEISYDEFVNGLAARDEWDTLLKIYQERLAAVQGGKGGGASAAAEKHVEPVLPFTYWVPAYHRSKLVDGAMRDFYEAEKQAMKNGENEEEAERRRKKLLQEDRTQQHKSREDAHLALDELGKSQADSQYNLETQKTVDMLRRYMTMDDDDDNDDMAAEEEKEKELTNVKHRQALQEQRRLVNENYTVQQALHRQGYTSSISLWKRAQENATEDGEMWNLNPEGQGEEAEKWRRHKQWTRWKKKLAHEEGRLRERKLMMESKSRNASRNPSRRPSVADMKKEARSRRLAAKKEKKRRASVVEATSSSSRRGSVVTFEDEDPFPVTVLHKKTNLGDYWVAKDARQVDNIRVGGLTALLAAGYDDVGEEEASEDEIHHLHYGADSQVSAANKRRIAEDKRRKELKKLEAAWK